VQDGLYADALALLNTVDAAMLPDKEQRTAHIRGLHAVSLFSSGKYQESMKIFIELEVNPAKVIALYPESVAGRLCTPQEKWIDLYKGKKMHEKALSLLKELANEEDDIEEKIDPTIRYLQKLGEDYLELIFRSSRWVFDIDPNRGLQIFTSEEAQLPRPAIIDYLEQIDLLVCTRFIEFLIEDQKQTESIFHNRLAELYLEIVIHSKKSEEQRKSIYSKLLAFIDFSEHYHTDRIFARLPPDDLFEARAILLGRLGKHEGALDIYVNRLKDYHAAEEYCKRVYAQDPDPRGVFLSLLKIYLRPSSSANLLQPALDLIVRQGPHLDSIETLQLLPPLVTAESVRGFLVQALRTPRIETRVMAKVWKARVDSVNERTMGLHQRRVRVTDSRICPQCHKRLGNSVIAVHAPRGEVTHYQCREAFSRKLNG
jgi:tetratricopeptide (TPR) repeat protein